MALAAGDRIGPYEIVERLGAGGMGQVFRARDSRLGREVALKILPDNLLEDQVSRARFEREARAVAALSHPNVLGIHDFGEHEGVVYAAMELLEGENLRQRLGGQPLPVSKAVEIALAIARGLAAAHDREIVHRDLKPENVFLNRNGQVKILDFGLAKAEPAEGTAFDQATTALVSVPGALFGTIDYMSPEQLRGEPAGPQADIFALGVVLYEMLAGHRPFQRDSLADVMTAILTQDPEPITTGERQLPQALEQILRHCLEKRPQERFQSAHDLAFALAAISTTTSAISLPPELPSQRGSLWRRWPAKAALLLALVAAFGLGWWLARLGPGTPAAAAPPRFTQLTFQPGIESSPSLAPGGNAFAYVGDAAGNEDIYIQRIGGQTAINLTPDSPVPDTAPALSPDGQHIAFRSERLGGGIFIMGATGESVRRVTDLGFDPSWSPDGLELVVSTEPVRDPLARLRTAELWRVRIADGQRHQLTDIDAVQPDWSPSGKRIAFWAAPAATGQRDVLTIPANGGPPVAVTDDPWVDWNPVWSPDGSHLYFSSDRGGTMNLWRVAIDEATGEVLSEPEPVTTPSKWSGGISFSDAGQLVYVAEDQSSTIYRAAFDPVTEQISVPEPLRRGSQIVDDVHLSPDGRWVAFTTGGLREDLHVVRTDGSGHNQLTDDPFRDRGPQWAPDGSRIAFYSNRSGRYEVWSVRPDGSGLQQLTGTEGPAPWYPTWSPEGDLLAASNATAVTIYSLDRPPGEAEAVELPVLGGRRRFLASSWSRDGRLLAGCSVVEGALAEGVFVFSIDEGRYETLAEDGFHPIWLGDGKRLLIWRDGGLSLIERGSQRVVELLSGRLGSRGWRNFSVDGDDRLIVFTQTVRQADIWLMTFE